MAIDPLHHILAKATEQGKLRPLRGNPTRASLYADDAAIFVARIKEDIQFLASTLGSFGEVTGLVTNYNKSHVAPIRCANIDLDEILQAFPAVWATFPMRYLGLPLSVARLKRIHFQYLEDKVAAKLPPWSAIHVATPGRIVLVKAVLTAIAIYHLTPLDLPIEVRKKIDSLRRAYLWVGCDKVTGGKCKVNWDLVCKPKVHGGLGVLNLKKFATALRLRWLWFEWADPPKPWARMGTPCSDKDKDLFAAATTVTIGDGNKDNFWESSWLNGFRPKDIAPKIFEISKRKNYVVSKALDNNFWIHQINTAQGLTLTHLQEFANLWEMVAGVTLSQDRQDTISWKFTTSREYTTSSAYLAQFVGLTYSTNTSMMWKTWAPPKCKFFAWLILQNRVWTADRLFRRGWPNYNLCPLCKQIQKSAAHLLFQCRFTNRVWNEITIWLGIHDCSPMI